MTPLRNTKARYRIDRLGHQVQQPLIKKVNEGSQFFRGQHPDDRSARQWINAMRAKGHRIWVLNDCVKD